MRNSTQLNPYGTVSKQDVVRGSVEKSRRAGFTLIETLVVVSVLGVVVAIIIPAVQAARESSRRLECCNHFKQLGIALAQHCEQRNCFPAAATGRFRIVGGHRVASDLSALYDLLPFLGEVALFNAFNVAIDDANAISTSLAQNQTAKSTRLDSFLCPSDAGLPSEEPGPNSYRFNVGTGNYPFEEDTGDYLGKGAAFAILKRLRAADYMDGLSQTVSMSERLAGSGSNTIFDRSRDYWYADIVSLTVPQKADQLIMICGAFSKSPPVFTTSFGRSWCWASYGGTWYNHVDSPNSPTPDCSAEGKTNEASLEITHYGSISARSSHSNGVQSLMADGSVSFVKNGIHRSVWRALGTRSGAELISSGTW